MSTPTPDGWLPTTVQALLDQAGDDVARLEVALLAAWRPTTLLAHADLPGCVLRWHHQMTKRANSLLVLGPPLPRSTALATSWYARRAPAQAPLAMTRCPLPQGPDRGAVLIMTCDLAQFPAAGQATGAQRPDQPQETPSPAPSPTRAPALWETSPSTTSSPCSSPVSPAPWEAGPRGPGRQGPRLHLGSRLPRVLLERTAARGMGTPDDVARARALLLCAPGQVFATVSQGGEVVGVARLAVTGVNDVAVLDGVWVAPRSRRRGTASHMIRHLAHQARHLGARHLALEVEADNLGAIACYERLGMGLHHAHRYTPLAPWGT